MTEELRLLSSNLHNADGTSDSHNLIAFAVLVHDFAVFDPDKLVALVPARGHRSA